VSDFYDPTVQWVPKNIIFDNLKAAVQAMEYWKSLFNTLIVGIVPALLQFCTCAIYAYGMARFKFRGRNILSAIMFLNILVPVTMLIIPTYVNFQHMDFLGILGLINKISGVDIRPSITDSPLAFYLPAIFGVGLKSGLYIYIYTQFFKGLPKELEEAAWIDGAGPWKTFLRIIIPSSGSAAITVLIFSVIWNYSDYYLPQIYLSENLPLSVMLNRFQYSLGSIMEYYIENGSDLIAKHVIIASCLIFLIPLITFYSFVQKKFIASISTTGLVG
jgi:multiple sugar transport system permease protein